VNLMSTPEKLTLVPGSAEVPLPRVNPILGRIGVENALLTTGTPAANSTRWIIDVDGGQDDITFQLLEHRSGRPVSPTLLSISFLPRSADFYEARPFASVEAGMFKVHHLPKTLCSYRITIDAMHSATR
jgi:hypothetical protein